MIEIGIVGLIVGGLLALGWLVQSVSSLTLLLLSLGIVGVGLVIGVPFGIRYHLLLRRALRARGALPRRWYMHPTQYHGELDDAGRTRVRGPFYLGALGFVLIVVGGCLSLLVLVTRFRP